MPAEIVKKVKIAIGCNGSMWIVDGVEGFVFHDSWHRKRQEGWEIGLTRSELVELLEAKGFTVVK